MRAAPGRADALLGPAAGAELSSGQTRASVLLLCQFCRHASVLYGVYGCLLLASAVAVAFQGIREAPSSWPFRIADFASTMGASAQMLLSYYIYVASADFEARYNERRALYWHIELAGFVDVRRIVPPTPFGAFRRPRRPDR